MANIIFWPLCLYRNENHASIEMDNPVRGSISLITYGYGIDHPLGGMSRSGRIYKLCKARLHNSQFL